MMLIVLVMVMLIAITSTISSALQSTEPSDRPGCNALGYSVSVVTALGIFPNFSAISCIIISLLLHFNRLSFLLFPPVVCLICCL